jgi:hypothetical protein
VSPSRIRHARMTIVWTVAAAFALHGALWYWSASHEPFIDDKEFQERFDTYRDHRAKTFSKGGKVIALVGSSHVAWGLRARIVEERLAAQCERAPLVHNFGIAQAGPLFNWAVVRRLVTSPAPPDVCVVEINPPYCGQIGDHPYEAGRLPNEKFLSAERRQIERFGHQTGNPLRWSGDFVPRWHHLRTDLLDALRPGLTAPRHKGAFAWDTWGDSPLLVGDVKLERRDYFTKLARSLHVGVLQNFHFHPACFAAMDDILRMCQASNISVALLLTPEADEYHALYGPGTEPALREAVHRLCVRGTVCFDARAWLPESSHYLDMHHLLDNGVEIFSQHFADECLVPWVRGDSAPAESDRFRTTSFSKRPK